MHTATILNEEPLWRAFKRLKADPKALLHYFGIAKPPVDVEAVAEAIGVQVIRFFEKRDWSGAIDLRYGEPVIWIRGRDAATRQRFTIAHELGHLLLHDGVVLLRDDTFSGRNPMEREANRFAAELLMPAALVRSQALRHGRNPARLARIFNVSPDAMAIRLKELGIR